MKLNILAVIQARGGSKRIPLKNLVELGGKPLVAYPILLAKASKFINRIVLSTDHDKIMEAGRTYGAEIPFRRPPELSEDVPSELVTMHAVRHLQESEGYRSDIVVTLTPATPFTRTEHVDQGIQQLLDHDDWDSVTTVRPAQEHPEWMLWRDEHSDQFVTVLGNPLSEKYNVSQNLKPAYYLAGAFFITRTTSLMKNSCLYGNKFGAVMLGNESIDIDINEDLEKARRIIAQKS